MVITNVLKVFLMLFILVSFQATAIESRMRLASAQPTSKQNLDISEIELSYLPEGNVLFSQLDLQWYPVLNLGYLALGDESTLTLGGALGFLYSINNNLHIFTEGGVTWLQQYEFGQPGIAFKDYGGHWQFQGKFGVDYSIRKNWNLGYAYLHMSNGGRYNINPSLDAHSLYITYQF